MVPSRPVTENVHVVDAELARGRFSFIYRNSFQKEVKVKYCFPLLNSRTICQSAIIAFQRLFDVDECGVIGYNYAGGFRIVVKMPHEELDLVKRYLLGIGKTECEANAAAYDQGIEWFGIVDGEHTHAALLLLEQTRPDPFQDFKWVVTVIEWQQIGVLKAFSRARNMLQSKNVVEMTLYDTIQGLYEITEEKAKLAGDTFENFVKQRGAITRIADEFCGGSRYSRQTMRTLTGAALRIKPIALAILGQIMTEEDAPVARKVMERCNSEASREEDVFDARAYKNIISTNTLRSATTFLNADAQDQWNALLKLKFGYEENGFKCFQASRLNKETERSGRARRQIQLMNTLMCREKWPEELADVEKKLLVSSRFDSELDAQNEDGNEILPSLILEYSERMPLEAGLRLHFYEIERRRESQWTDSRRSTRRNMANDTENEQAGLNVSENQNAQQETENTASEDEGERRHQCPLVSLDITCLNLTLERYLTQRKAEDPKFHLVTGDPTQLQLKGTCKVSVDGHQANKYVGMLRVLVNSHGWVFLYTRAVDYALWDKAFRANGFDPLDYPWLMVRNTDTVQENTSPIPQNVAEMLIGARKKDVGRPEFQPDITSRYKRAVSSRKRKFAIMDSCTEPRMKLRKRTSREPVRTNQRSCEPMAEFLETFCPPNGNVLDAFAGTLETAAACIMTGRRCVAVEADKHCFEVALKRLKEIAEGYCADHNPSQSDEQTENVRTPPDDHDGNMKAREDSRETEHYSESEAVMESRSENSLDMSTISDETAACTHRDNRTGPSDGCDASPR